MAGRDMGAVKVDMLECIKHVTSSFKNCNVPLEAAPIAELALAMFNDYRGNSPRDIAEYQAEADRELLKLEHRLNQDK